MTASPRCWAGKVYAEERWAGEACTRKKRLRIANHRAVCRAERRRPPRLDAGATSFLPREPGRGGLLLIEEINRAPRSMQACWLELLTSRRLNSYRLPAGWLPVACINPQSDGYHLDLLDAALMSWFMRIDVCAAVEPRAARARANGIHPKIVE